MKSTMFALAAAMLLSLGAPAQAAPPGADPDWGLTVGMSQGRLGAQVQDMTPELRAYFGAPKDAGILIGSVEKDSTAEKSGLRVGDVITKVDGNSIDQPWEVMTALASKRKGDAVDVVGSALNSESLDHVVAGD